VGPGDVRSEEYECVEPGTGDQIWRLGSPGTPPELQEKLRRHLAVCDSCRLVMAADGFITSHADALAGVPMLRPARVLRPRRFALPGGVALAASLALAFLLPPSAPRQGGMRAADDRPAVLRPVEGERVLGATPEVRWREVDGATSYRVVVESRDGAYRWSGSTRDTRATVPASRPVPPGVPLRVVVETVPDDLLPLGAMSAGFRRGGAAEVAGYRLRRAPWYLQAGAAAGLLALGAALVLRRVDRGA
jgi:hypothetical protein